MSDYGIDLRPLIYIFIFLGAIIVGAAWGGVEIYNKVSGKKNNVTTKELLVPELIIKIKNGVSDTTYVYRIP